MNSINENHRRIAKNTFTLYMRMAFLMLISLYTSRVVLKNLGVEDYGVYNVVGGFVAVFTLFSNSLSTAISRFITIALGEQNTARLKNIFSCALSIQMFLGLSVLFIGEILGCWYINTKLVISPDRLFAAMWVYQFSLFTFSIGLLGIPYNALIIAHERMSAFAYISLFEGIAKLTIAFAIAMLSYDKLITYGFLLSLMSILIQLIYMFYCMNNFVECQFQFQLNKEILKELFFFSSWNFLGSASTILRDQGGNIILNLFCGPVVNAARGITNQVCGAVNIFSINFMTALNPQITKSYAASETEETIKLINLGSRFSFLLLTSLSVPIIFNISDILRYWLHTVPDHTSSFVILSLVFVLSESLTRTIVTASLATGKIRDFQLYIGVLQLFNLPIAYIFLRLGAQPEVTYVISIVISQLCVFLRVYLIRKYLNYSFHIFFKEVYYKCLLVFGLSCILPYMLTYLPYNTSFMILILKCSVIFVSSLIILFYIGLKKSEQSLIINKIKGFF